MRLELIAPGCTIEASDTETRTLRGIAVPYGQAGNTSAGRVTVDAGAVRVPQDLRTVKLFRGHGRLVPVGFAADAADAADALRMGFTVARTDDGDRALLEASEGVRDAFSVELDNVVIRAGHVVSADLVAVAQVAVPAFAGARLNAALTDDEQATVLEHAQAIVDLSTPPEEQPPADDQTPPSDATAAAPNAQETTVNRSATAPVQAAAAPASLSGMTPATTNPRPADPTVARRLIASQISEAMRGASDVAQINAALADITPANAGTDGLFPRPAWIGELWTPEAPQRAIVNAIGVSPLTGMTMDGWRWVNKPVVGPYAGNKAEIPTSPASVEPASATAQRIAGGWDLDRIYVDFNTGFVEAFMAAAAQDYRTKSQSYFIDGHAAVVGPPAVPAAEGFMDEATDLGPQGSVIGAVNAVVSFLIANGANVSFIVMGGAAYLEFLSLTSDEAPWWLAKQGTLNLGNGVNIDGLTIGTDPGIPDNAVTAGDRAAVSLWETGPINVQAVNVPNGGIDLALFGYWAQMVHDAAGLATANTGAVPPAAARKSSSSSS